MVVVEPGPFTTELFPTSPRPADSDGRVSSCPAVAHDNFANLEAAFHGLFSDESTPTDPMVVVDRIIELTKMKPGTRPFRSVVGVDFGVQAHNDATAPFDAAVLDAFGMTSFATLAS